MLRVYTCIVDEHHPRLVVVAAVICLLASIVAFSSFEQVLANRSRRHVWTALAPIVAGLGIWSHISSPCWPRLRKRDIVPGNMALRATGEAPTWPGCEGDWSQCG